MPLANTPAVLNLLDGPVAVDPAFHIVWSRFRMMRRYLSYYHDEEPRMFRMLDLISRGAHGHGPDHLLHISAAELGFAWDGAEKGWVRVSLPLLRTCAALPICYFGCLAVLVFSLGFLKERVFGEVNLLIFMVLYNNLPRPTFGNEIKCC